MWACGGGRTIRKPAACAAVGVALLSEWRCHHPCTMAAFGARHTAQRAAAATTCHLGLPLPGRTHVPHVHSIFCAAVGGNPGLRLPPRPACSHAKYFAQRPAPKGGSGPACLAAALALRPTTSSSAPTACDAVLDLCLRHSPRALAACRAGHAHHVAVVCCCLPRKLHLPACAAGRRVAQPARAAPCTAPTTRAAAGWGGGAEAAALISMVVAVLNVAEKPSVAKEVSRLLSNGTASNRRGT